MGEIGRIFTGLKLKVGVYRDLSFKASMKTSYLKVEITPDFKLGLDIKRINFGPLQGKQSYFDDIANAIEQIQNISNIESITQTWNIRILLRSIMPTILSSINYAMHFSYTPDYYWIPEDETQRKLFLQENKKKLWNNFQNYLCKCVEKVAFYDQWGFIPEDWFLALPEDKQQEILSQCNYQNVVCVSEKGNPDNKEIEA